MPAETRRRAAAGALVVLACSVASAAAAWSPAEQASVGPLAARSPDVAMNRRGDAAAAWVRGTGRKAMVVVSLRAADGGWSRPEGVSRRGRPAVDPQVALDADGRVVVVWRQVVGSRLVRFAGKRRRKPVLVVRARERQAAAARWDPIRTLSSPRQTAGRPDLAIDGRGVAVATWHWGTGNTSADPGYHGEVQVSEGHGAQTWSLPVGVSGSDACDRLRAARVSVGDAGEAVVWWQCDLAGDRTTAYASSRVPDQPFTADRELPFQSAGALAADLVVSGNGTVVGVSAEGVVLHFWRGPVLADGISLEELPVAGSRPSLDPDGGPPQVDVNAGGDALAAWIGADLRTRAAVIAADLGVAAPTAVGPRKAEPPRRAGGGGRRAPGPRGVDGLRAGARHVPRRRRLAGHRHPDLGRGGVRRPGARGGDGRPRRRGRVLDAGPRRPHGRRALGALRLRTPGRRGGLGLALARTGVPCRRRPVELHASRITVTRVSFRDVRASHAIREDPCPPSSRPTSISASTSSAGTIPPTTCSSRSAA